MRLAALLMILLVACGSATGSNSRMGTEPPGSSEPAPAEGGESITGTLGGDPKLEGGCSWVDDGKVRWQVQYPDGYDMSLEPVRLTGPDGQTAGKGDKITVAGTEIADAMTTCQVGPVWAATSVDFGG